MKEPRALVEPQAALVPGTDGRKMSKSYDNVVPLFGSREDFRRLVRRVPTDSAAAHDPKDPEANVLAAWMRCVSTRDQADHFERGLRSGLLGWGAAKDLVVEAFDQTLSSLRAAYRAIRADESALEARLAAGARRAQEEAARVLTRVRRSVFGIKGES